MHERHSFSILVVVLLVFPVIPCVAQIGTGTFVSRTLEHDGYSRWYKLYVPSAYDGSEDWPLVISFHGGLWEADDHIMLDRLASVADTAHFLIAYPQGRVIDIKLSSGGWRTGPGWNVDGSFGDWDDVAFAGAVIDDVDTEYAVDLNRVHATGFSFGSVMSFALACRLSDRIASIGGVGGPMFESQFTAGCNATRPVPTLLVHGTQDPIVPLPSGGPYGVLADRTIAFWADHNGCSRDPTVTDLPDLNLTDNSTVTRIEYPDCQDEAEVLYYRINGGGHTWPGTPYSMLASLGAKNMDIVATAEIWDFFERHPHPDPPPYPSYVPFGWNLDWTYTRAGIHLRGVFFADAHTGMIIGTDHQQHNDIILHTSDAGATWTTQIIGSGLFEDVFETGNLFLMDANTGIAVGSHGTLLRTTDGGTSWTRPTSVTTADLTDVYFTDANTGTVVGTDGTILRTTDGGTTWIQQTSGTTASLSAVDFTDAMTGTVVGGRWDESENKQYGIILRTTDGGTTWVQQAIGTTGWLHAVDFTDVNTGMIFGFDDSDFILRTSDGGTTWTRESPDLGEPVDPRPPVHDDRWMSGVHFADANTGMAVYCAAWCMCMEGAVVRTTDGGATWERAQLKDVGFSDIYVIDANTAVAVGWTDGTLDAGAGPDDRRGVILRLTFGMPTPIEPEPRPDPAIPGGFSLSQNYPNPFNPTTTITYTLPRPADVTLTVYDLLGRTVRLLASGTRPAGTYEVTFDATGLSSGLYLYRLQAGTYVEMKRMLVVR